MKPERLWTSLTHYSSVSIVNFEHVIANWGVEAYVSRLSRLDQLYG